MLKRFVLGNREESVDGLTKAIAVRLMAGNQPTLAELAEQLMPNAKPGFRRHQIAMAAKILGRGMHNDIGPKLNRALQIGRAIGVIDNDLRPMLVRDFGDGFYINQTHVRVGRGFEIDNLGLVRNRLFQFCRIGQIDMGMLDAKFFQVMA